MPHTSFGLSVRSQSCSQSLVISAPLVPPQWWKVLWYPPPKHFQSNLARWVDTTYRACPTADGSDIRRAHQLSGLSTMNYRVSYMSGGFLPSTVRAGEKWPGPLVICCIWRGWNTTHLYILILYRGLEYAILRIPANQPVQWHVMVWNTTKVYKGMRISHYKDSYELTTPYL